MRLAAMRGRDRRSEKIFQLEYTAAGRHVFVGGDARHGRFVHADGLGDGLEIERPQMLDAASKKRILLADNLVGDFEDGPGALVEGANEPGGTLQALGEIGLVGVAAGRRGDLGVVTLIDQNLGQRIGIEFYQPRTVRRGADKNVRHDWLDDGRAKSETGLR